MLHLTLAQLNPTVGNIQKNASVVLDVWQRYDTQSGLIVFPELFLCGYPPEDLILNHAFMYEIEKTIGNICEHSENLKSACVLPTPLRLDEKTYNSALIIRNGKIIHHIEKHELPNFSVFDEKRIFSAGSLQKPFDLNGYKIGVMICEDAWHQSAPQNIKKNDADLTVIVNASPFTEKKHEQRLNILKKSVDITQTPTIYLNMVGGQDELVFDGHSIIIDQNKDIIFESIQCEEDIIKAQFDKKTITVINGTQNTTKNQHETLYNSACLGLRDYVRKNNFQKVLIGLSGGIDSALTASICVDALDAENVRCIMMPSEFTSQDSLNDAKQCAEMLNVKYEIIPIKDAVKTFENLIPNLDGLAHENTQSRIRGLILMALSNISGEMLITTGNKSEMAVGYCTIYGDMNGGFNPLKDIYKTDVYALSEWRNKQGNVIPSNIISKAPSAELRLDQKDQDSLPPYDVLDKILKMLIEYDNLNWYETDKSFKDTYDCHNFKKEDIEKVAKLLKISEYKRFQAPPGPRLTERAFGKDRRYPMTNGFTNKIQTERKTKQ